MLGIEIHDAMRIRLSIITEPWVFLYRDNVAD